MDIEEINVAALEYMIENVDEIIIIIWNEKF